MTPQEFEPRVTACIDAVVREINEAYFCPRNTANVDRVLLALTSKAATLARAVCCLARSEFYGESFGLSRSSVEAFLLVKYISNKDREERATDYLNFFKAHLHNAERLRKKHFARRTTPDGLREEW